MLLNYMHKKADVNSEKQGEKIIKMNVESKNHYFVEKEDTRVMMLLDLGKPKKEECIIRLNLTSRSGTGSETINEFLENLSRFIPIRIGASKSFTILNSDSIIYVLEKGKVELHSTINYDLHLKGNINLRVGQYVNMPRVGGRFLDILGQDEKYANFLFRGSKIYINKDKIIKGNDNE